MPAFSYVALDARGRTRRGIIDAQAPRQARAGLRSEGLVPLELAPVGRTRARLARGELALFTRRFALLLDSGLGVGAALDALIEQEPREASRRVLAALRAELGGGLPLAAALEQHPGSFPELYRAVVASGEQSGELAGVMSRLADYLEARQAARRDAGLALVYPAIVAAVALVIMTALLVSVVPQIVEVFERSGQALPLLTRALLWSSGALSQHGVWIVLSFALAALAARAALGRPSIRKRWHAALLGLPIAGALARASDSARLAGTLGILIESGVPLLQALAAGAKVVVNLQLRADVEEAARRVREGVSLQRALGAGGRFPPILVHLVASGEASGRLAQTLGQAARQLEWENLARVRLLAAILEPAIVVAMGALVLLFVLAVLLPIIEMNQLARLR